MSGGTFNYDQYKIGNIADDIEKVIERNGRKKTEEELKEESSWSYQPDWYKQHPEELYYNEYSDEVIEKFKEAVKILRQAEVYAQRVDFLLSNDDGEESFLKRLEEDLKKLN